MREMRKELAKFLVVLGGVALGVAVFLGLLAFAVSDSCLDSGGAVGTSYFVCLMEDGKELPWVALVQPVVVVLLAGLVAIPGLYFVYWLLRRIERKNGPGIHA